MLTYNLNLMHTMHTMPHTLNMPILHMFIMHKHIMSFYMPRCTHAPIAAEKVTFLSFVMIGLMLLMIMFRFERLTITPQSIRYGDVIVTYIRRLEIPSHIYA